VNRTSTTHRHDDRSDRDSLEEQAIMARFYARVRRIPVNALESAQHGTFLGL
jgi:hypothetical protein